MMKTLVRDIVLAICVASSVWGCNLRQGFQPLPPLFKSWAKEGVSPEGVKAALLECGYDNPYIGFQTYKDVSSNQLECAHQCMQLKGFRYLLRGGRTICNGKETSDLPTNR